jgi:AdoMet-dependent heme synthase
LNINTKYPFLIDWATTYKCNLSCRHCRGMREGEISSERIRGLLDEIAQLKPGWLIIEGGEPLLRDDIYELLTLARRKNLEVHLITNGMLLNSDWLSSLKKLGIRVMISIDGGNKETYENIRIGANFEKVVKVAVGCVQEGILEAINFTVMKKNFREIPEIFKLAASIGVKRVTFIGLKSCASYTEELLSADEYAEAIRLACEGSIKTGVEFYFDEPFFWAVVKEKKLTVKLPLENAGILFSKTTACIFGDYLFIEPNGEVKPCSFAPMVIGNVKEKPLDTIWQENLSSPLMSQLRDPGTRNGNCRSCCYLTDCKGCRSRTYVLTGDWFADDPVCPLRGGMKNESIGY